MIRILALLTALAAAAAAQQIKFAFDKLAAKASETVNVTLDQALLQMATRFMKEKDADEARVKKLIAGLKAIHVHSFEFDKEGEYTEADLEALRAQVKAPEWQRIITVRSKKDGENVDVYIKGRTEQVTGLVIIAAEPRELAVVDIEGPIDLESLSELGGRFGIPRSVMEKTRKAVK
jgi:hypothetical protein